MISNFLWIFLLILQCGIVTPRSTPNQFEKGDGTYPKYNYETQNRPKDENANEEKVISVRITSSVAVGRSKANDVPKSLENNHHDINVNLSPPPDVFDASTTKNVLTDLPPNLVGANIEFIRQLNAKKDTRSHHVGPIHPMQLNSQNFNETEFTLHKTLKKNNDLQNNEEANMEISTSSFQTPSQQFNLNEDSLAEPSDKSVFGINDKNYQYEKIDNLPIARSMPQTSSHISRDGPYFSEILTGGRDSILNNTEDTEVASSFQSISTISNKNKTDDNIENIPIGRSLPFSPSSKNYIQGLTSKPPSERGNNPSLTTVSFNVVHDTPKQTADYNAQTNIYTNANQGFDSSNKFYEPPKVYSQPAKIYSEPAKFYSEPAKIYSEPAKVYSEPAKVYSEPAKIYSEPAKFYSPPASLHLTPEVVPNHTPWQHTAVTSTLVTTNPTTVDTVPPGSDATQRVMQPPEKNYEVDEKDSVLTEGRSHGVQETSTENCKQDNCKVGYVVEGRQYKKYRVEERTPDGFIVGEYGVVRNEDGALRGVRYTADSDASPRLIYDALMKFLQLK